MATPEPQKTLPAGDKALENLMFNFTECRNPDPLIRKSTFQLKLRNGIIQDDGGYREPVPMIDGEATKILSVSETATLIQDSVTLASGKELTGAEVAEAVGIFADRSWAGDYDTVIVDDEPTV